jgi:hypothetical protein
MKTVITFWDGWHPLPEVTSIETTEENSEAVRYCLKEAFDRVNLAGMVNSFNIRVERVKE